MAAIKRLGLTTFDCSIKFMTTTFLKCITCTITTELMMNIVIVNEDKNCLDD